jgi:hypothetical protein
VHPPINQIVRCINLVTIGGLGIPKVSPDPNSRRNVACAPAGGVIERSELVPFGPNGRAQTKRVEALGGHRVEQDHADGESF